MQMRGLGGGLETSGSARCFSPAVTLMACELCYWTEPLFVLFSADLADRPVAG